MVSCCAPNCKSKSNSKRYKSTEKVSFHEFPSNLERRAAWIKRVGRQDWLPSDTQRLCNKHFTDDQFKVGTKCCHLLPTAVPTIFEGSQVTTPKSKSPQAKSERPRRTRAVLRKTDATTDAEAKSDRDVREAELSNGSCEIGPNSKNGKRCIFSENSSESGLTAGSNESPKLPEKARETAENVKTCKPLETCCETEESAKCNSNSKFTETRCDTIITAANGNDAKLLEVARESLGTRRLIVVARRTETPAKDGKKYRLLEIPRKLGQTENSGKKYKLREISSEILERAKSCGKPKFLAVSASAQNPKLPSASCEAMSAMDLPWPNDVEQHLATERKLKANQKMIYRQKAKISSQKNEIAALKAALQKFTAMPLLEKLQCIEQAAREDKLHARFLLCQIKGFGKKRVSWDGKLVRCFKHWRAMSAKGYDFPRTCGLLRLPHPSSLGRYADSSQADAAINAAIQDLVQLPEGTVEDVQDVTFLCDECDVAVTTIPSEDCSDVVYKNSNELFPQVF